MPKTMRSARYIAIALCLSATGISAAPTDINLQPSAVGFNRPVGIDWQDTSAKLIMSVNYSEGDPFNFNLVDPVTGIATQFSALTKLFNEVKVATVRSGTCMGGFADGEVFAGNGLAGQILRINPSGTAFTTITLPGEPAEIRGSLFQDRFCVAGGDLIVATGNEQNGVGSNDDVGNVWRVTSAGVATKIATVGIHLEGLTTAPNNPTLGPLAGRILAGAEDYLLGSAPSGYSSYDPTGGIIVAINPAAVDDFFTVGGPGTIGVPLHVHMVTSTPYGFHPEDLDLIRKNADFFGIDFGGGQVLQIKATDTSAPNFTARCGELLITQEFPDPAHPSGLYAMRWDAASTSFIVDPLTLVPSSKEVVHWEHVTFTSGEDCALPPPPQLAILKTPKAGVFSSGSQVTFSIVVSNPAATGAADATNVVLTDQLPGNGGLIWTTATTTQGSCSIVANLLSCNLGTIAPQGSVTVTVKSGATTPAAACQSQPNPIARATADGNLSVQDSGSLTCSPPANLATVTQGGWHASPHGNNPGTILNAWFVAHPTYKAIIGDVTNACGGKTLTFTTANAIRAFLPAGSTPGVLAATATNPTTSAAGVFAGQVLALTLNVQVLPSGSSLSTYVMTSGPAAGKTVGQILADADKAIGGCGLPSYAASISNLNDIVTSINEMFD